MYLSIRNTKRSLVSAPKLCKKKKKINGLIEDEMCPFVAAIFPALSLTPSLFTL